MLSDHHRLEVFLTTEPGRRTRIARAGKGPDPIALAAGSTVET
ncbi:MAG: hypothetical protein ACRDRG_10260 [Pseudonocardiaceae bacterium]